MKTIRKYSRYFSEGSMQVIYPLAFLTFIGLAALKLTSYSFDFTEHYPYLLDENVYKFISTSIIFGAMLLYVAVKIPSSLIVLLCHYDTKKDKIIKRKALKSAILAPLFCLPVVAGLVIIGAIEEAEKARAEWHINTAISIAKDYADTEFPYTFVLSLNPFSDKNAIISVDNNVGQYKIDGVGFDDCLMLTTLFPSSTVEGYTQSQRDPETSCKIFTKVKISILI